MRKPMIPVCLGFAMVLLGICCFAQDSESYSEKTYRSPEHFEKDIKRFEAHDRRHFPPQDAIVCIGSSSMRGWSQTIHDDLAPLTIIVRGFGGSNMNDALHYAGRIVLSYRPRAIVIYEGDNDVAQGISPQKIADTFRAFVERTHRELPDCRIYFLSIKPSIRRWHMWPQMKEANRLIVAECGKDRRLTYVDVASGMLNEEGTPRKRIFKNDKLHMTGDGYLIWRDALRKILLPAELQYEKQKTEAANGMKE